MWGTSSPTDKLTGDLGNVIEATQTGVRRSDRLPARKSSPGNFGLLQHNLPVSDICGAANWALLITSPQHPSLSRTRRDRLHRRFHNVVTNAKPHIRAAAGREPVMETG